MTPATPRRFRAGCPAICENQARAEYRPRERKREAEEEQEPRDRRRPEDVREGQPQAAREAVNCPDGAPRPVVYLPEPPVRDGAELRAPSQYAGGPPPAALAEDLLRQEDARHALRGRGPVPRRLGIGFPIAGRRGGGNGGGGGPGRRFGGRGVGTRLGRAPGREPLAPRAEEFGLDVARGRGASSERGLPRRGVERRRFRGAGLRGRLGRGGRGARAAGVLPGRELEERRDIVIRRPFAPRGRPPGDTVERVALVGLEGDARLGRGRRREERSERLALAQDLRLEVETAGPRERRDARPDVRARRVAPGGVDPLVRPVAEGVLHRAFARAAARVVVRLGAHVRPSFPRPGGTFTLRGPARPPTRGRHRSPSRPGRSPRGARGPPARS